MSEKHEALPDGQQFTQALETLAEQLAPLVEAKTRHVLRERGLSRLERKRALCGFAGATGNGDRLGGGDRLVRFFTAVLGGDAVTAKALSEGASTSGGSLVPEEFRSEIIARLPEQAELAPYVRVVPVRAESGSIPCLSGDISITWRGGSTAPAENQAFGETQPELGKVAWSLKRADAITKISRELVADGQPPVIEFITRLFQEAIARERDRMIAVGSAAGVTAGTQPVGLENSTLAAGNTVDIGGALAYADLVEIEHTLKRQYRQRARWVMNSKNLHRIFALVDDNHRPLFTREAGVNGAQTFVLGYPVSIQDDLADSGIFFGDLSCYLWFDRGEMGVESTTAGGDAFANHQTWVKVWERADGKLAVPEAFVKGSGITA